MTRTEALAALIDRVEAGEGCDWSEGWRGVEQTLRPIFTDFRLAFDGSLDAVARLEAPLRERGWDGASLSPDSEEPRWLARLRRYPDAVTAFGPTEPHARLLAVLRALHHEASR